MISIHVMHAYKMPGCQLYLKDEGTQCQPEARLGMKKISLSGAAKAAMRSLARCMQLVTCGNAFNTFQIAMLVVLHAECQSCCSQLRVCIQISNPFVPSIAHDTSHMMLHVNLNTLCAWQKDCTNTSCSTSEIGAQQPRVGLAFADII